MAVFFPSDAKAKDAPGGPEQKVLNALKKELDDSWKVIPNLYLAKHEKQLRGGGGYCAYPRRSGDSPGGEGRGYLQGE